MRLASRLRRGALLSGRRPWVLPPSGCGSAILLLSGALFKQIGIYFLFPLVLGIAHTLCAMQVVIDVVRVFGYLDIGQVSVIAVAAFLAVYGAYFLVTYFTARNMVRFRRA